MTPFSGSYHPDDCIFLLKPLADGAGSILGPERREQLIQSGAAHYSDTIPLENVPDASYMRLFDEMFARHKGRLARELRKLALEIAARRPGPITVLSLARAGTPVGVLLTRALRRFQRRETAHFSISIIRDRGIDTQALHHVLHVLKRPAEGVVFVDGWTAKGTITRELKTAVARWNEVHPAFAVPDDLFVISDVGGQADVAATRDDYVIPSGILNGVISGLVSRSALVDVGPGDFHSCVFYDFLRPHDRSQAFVDAMEREMIGATPSAEDMPGKEARRARVAAFLEHVCARFGEDDINRIKPGIAEATRALLRRRPRYLLVRDQGDVDIQHTLLLARQKGIPVLPEPDMPFAATTLIRPLV